MRIGTAFGLMLVVVVGRWDIRADPISTVTPAESSPSAGIPADEALGRAAESVRRGQFDEALGQIREAAKAHPEWPTPRLILARILFAANQGPLARRALEQAAADAPDDPSVYLTFANLARADGRFSDARLNAEKALAALKARHLEGDRARAVRREARAGLAAVAESQNDWSAARDHLTAWLEDEPKNGPARQRLGRALFQLGRTDDALAALKRAVADEPKLEPAAVSMGFLFGKKGDLKKAAEWFEYARKADPKSVAARLGYARWLLEQGRPADAQPLADEAAKLDPNSKDVARLQGLLAWQRRDFATAERFFDTLHREAPADMAVADLLARALVEQNDAEKQARALQLAQVNARQAPKSADVLATLGRAHYRLGHKDEAERTLRAATAGGHASRDTAYFLARLLVDGGHAEEARTLLEKATALPGAFSYRREATEFLSSLPKPRS